MFSKKIIDLLLDKRLTHKTHPFLGCEPQDSCADTRYGCCKDGASIAQGLDFDGCPDSKCEDTL